MVKTKILLVEDDKSLREIYGVRLYSEGYDIISAGDGEEALALAIKEHPPLIISDVMMPKISGFDMLDILRSTTETKDIKVIMMTALSSEDQRARGEALGADRYLVKSQVGIEDVVRTVHDVLGDAKVTTDTASIPPAPTSAFAAPAALPANPTATSAGSLPQPTAPLTNQYSSTLGDRVIHPLESSEASKDFGAMMNAELDNKPQPNIGPAPQIAPEQPLGEPQIPVLPTPVNSFDQLANDIQAATPEPNIPVPTTAPEPAIVDQLPATEPAQMMPEPQVAAPATYNPVEQAPTGLSFEETHYAANPTIPTEPQQVPVATQTASDDNPPLMVPPRQNPGV